MIRKIFNKKIDNLSRAAFIIGFASLLSRILGLLRDRVLAAHFGAGPVLDSYYAAFRLPDFIYNLIVLGALSAGFIPIFAKYLAKSDDSKWFSIKRETKAWDFANNILNILLFVFILIGVIFFIFTKELISIITPGFSEEVLNMTVNLSRIMFFSQLLFAISSIFGGVLQTFRKFIIYSFAPILYNLGIILGVIVLVPLFGISGLAYGVVGGAFLHMFVQFIASVRLGYRYKFIFDLKSKDFKELILMMIPRTLSLAVVQFNFLIITILASRLGEGSLTSFNFANNIVHVPVGIFAISFAVAAFPLFSKYAILNKHEKIQIIFKQTVRKILFFIVPFSILFILLNDQIVRVLLGSGKFSWEDTISTSVTFRYLSISLLAAALIPLFTRVFYAYKNTLYPLVGAILNFIFVFTFGLFLSYKMGLDGLAIAFSVANVANLLYLGIILNKKFFTIIDKNICKFVLKILVASLLLAIITQKTKVLISPWIEFDTFVGIFMHGAISGSLGIVIYLLSCYYLKVEEFSNFYKLIKRKFVKNASNLLPEMSLAEEDDING